MLSKIGLPPLQFITFLLLSINHVWGLDIVCSEVGGTAKFVTGDNSCICLNSISVNNLPGTLCPTDPNGRAGCTLSCGLNCVDKFGGTCFISCNSGFTKNAAGVCVVAPTCNTGSACSIDTSNPNFKYAVATCKAGGTGCDYTCTKGQKGCADKDGCFSTCLNGTGVPQAKRRRDALLAEREKRERIAAVFASGPSGGVFSDKDICPIEGQMACAVPGATERDSFECIDPNADLKSCGGCVAEGGSGVDCSALEGAEGVQCVRGVCKIGTCKSRYDLVQGFNGQRTCVRSKPSISQSANRYRL